MPNMNLATENFKKENSSVLGKNLIISFVILALTVCLYAALVFMDKKLFSEIEDNKNRYKAEYNNFLSGGAADVSDFENRSAIAKKSMAADSSMNGVLDQVEASLVPAVYLDSYTYERNKKSVTLVCVADNFNTMAKQILSFKESGYFSSVIPGDSSSKAEENKITFSLSLKIK